MADRVLIVMHFFRRQRVINPSHAIVVLAIVKGHVNDPGGVNRLKEYLLHWISVKSMDDHIELVDGS